MTAYSAERRRGRVITGLVAVAWPALGCTPSPLELDLAGVLPAGTQSLVVAIERRDANVSLALQALATSDAETMLPFVDGLRASSSLVFSVATYAEPLSALQFAAGPLAVYSGAGRSRALPPPDSVFSRSIRLDVPGSWTRSGVDGTPLDDLALLDGRSCAELMVGDGPLTDVATSIVKAVSLDASRVLLFAVGPRAYLLELPSGRLTPLATPNVAFEAGWPTGDGGAFLGSATIDGRKEAALYQGVLRGTALDLTRLDVQPLAGATYRAITATEGLRDGQRVVALSSLGELVMFETSSRRTTTLRLASTATTTDDRAAGVVRMPPDASFGEVWAWTDHATGRVFAIPSAAAAGGPVQSPVREQTYGMIPESTRAIGNFGTSVLLATRSRLYVRGSLAMDFQVFDRAPPETRDLAAIVELPGYGALFVSNQGWLTLLDAASARFCPSLAPTSAGYVDAVALPDGSALAITRRTPSNEPARWVHVRAR